MPRVRDEVDVCSWPIAGVVASPCSSAFTTFRGQREQYPQLTCNPQEVVNRTCERELS